jgi:hypothetical protein
MAYDKFLVGYADNESGFQTSLKPWLISDNAFQILNNAYILRGRVRKRFGTVLMGLDQTQSRLRLLTTNTYATSVYSGTVPGDVFAVGQMFTINDDIFTVYQTGSPAAMLSTNVATSGTFDTTTGNFTFTGYSSGLDIWFYPATPVMGLTQYFVESSNAFATIGFDTQFAYQYDLVSNAWLRLTTANVVGTTDGSGNFSGVFFIDQMPVGTVITVGGTTFTVITSTLTTPYALQVSSGGTGSALFNPTSPGSGFGTLTITASNVDTAVTSSAASIWTGTDYEFFWSVNYQGAVAALDTLWTTNFNPPDGIRYWDNTFWVQPVLNWTVGTQIDTTSDMGAASGNVPDGFGFIGQVFVIGFTQFIVTVANGALVPVSSTKAGPIGTGTFNTTNGAYTFTGATISTPIFFTGNNYIQTAQIVVQFKNRLILLNTVEVAAGVAVTYPFRARYSAVGSALSATSWMQDIPGNGNAVDAPTQEAIVTVQFIKDRLIVYFTSSTYELVYTSNQTLPFTWQKINNELGAISTFSEIPFDKVVLGVDDNGIHACNGANVERIDNKIPQYPFGISNEMNGQDRVAGIRDYYNEMAYWTVVSDDRNVDFYFPNQILAYNYVNDSWATIDDSFTTFGYFFQPPEAVGITWGEATTPWGENSNQWNSTSSTTNNTTIKAIIAGNQEGFVQILQTNIPSSAPSLQVTNFTTTASGTATISCINHNLSLNDYVLFENMNGLVFTDSLGNVLPSLMARVTPDPVSANTPNEFGIYAVDNTGILPIVITGTYTGGGVISTVTNMNILTKQYNFYTENDRNMYMARIDFLVNRTNNGAVFVDYLTSSADISIVTDGLGTEASPGPLPGDGTLETSPYALSNFEQYQTRLWHPIYTYAEGECVQLQIVMSPSQMSGYTVNTDGSVSYVALNDFQMHAMIFYVTPTSNRMQ